MTASTARVREDDFAQLAVALPKGLTDLLGFHLRMAQATMYRDFAAAMGELSLTQRQMAVLEIVQAAPGISQVDIAAQLCTDRATMMAIVDRLQDRNLIERRRSKGDRRRQELFLTQPGLKTLAEARRIIAAHEKHFTDRFSPDELNALVEGLRRIQAPA